MSRPDGTLDFGGTLRRLREARGVALRDIADTTKVSVSALEALERNDVSRLPGGIFRRGIIRAYAGTIGADPEQLVRDFDAQFPREGPAARWPVERDAFAANRPTLPEAGGRRASAWATDPAHSPRCRRTTQRTPSTSERHT